MTKDKLPPLGGYGRDDKPNIVGVHETATARERLIERTCEWCHTPISYKGVGRPPRYCRPGHRQRASELRRAQARADRPAAEGGRATEPVREVVERTETITRTVVRQSPPEIQRVPMVRLSGEPYTLPADAIEWAQALAYLRAQTTSGQIPDFARESLAMACDRTARALRSEPGAPGVGTP